MPCKCDYDTPSVEQELREKISFLEAALCANLNAQLKQYQFNPVYNRHTLDGIIDFVLNDINYSEAGITEKQLRDWWLSHREKDRIRLSKERELFEREKLKQEALAKLSEQERCILGLL